MTTPARRYLDHPATSWPKPAPVLSEILRAVRDLGGAAGRGTHGAARAADDVRARARRAAARIAGGADPARVALVSGATLGLNMAIQGLLRPGWHVIATAADHNATLRPLHRLVERGVVELTVVPCDGGGRVDVGAIEEAWRAGTRAVVFSHASNVTGTLQDAAAITAVARRRGAITILDAAQTAGIVPLDVGAPGHKWLQGPQGVALVSVREGLEPEPLVQGGTGSESGSLTMPAALVERMEAGTPDLGALAGFVAAEEWLRAYGTALPAHGRRLAAACRAGLDAIDGVRTIGGGGDGPPIVAFTVEGYDPAEVAVLLEQLAGVEARAGLHCAALVHDCLGTAPGGTVRVGFGPFNTPADARAVAAAVAEIRGVPAPVVAFDDSPSEVPPWQT